MRAKYVSLVSHRYILKSVKCCKPPETQQSSDICIRCGTRSCYFHSLVARTRDMGSRQRVLMSFRDELYGVCKAFEDVVQEHFDIVYTADFEKQPEKYQDIVGIIVWASWGIEKKFLDSLPNLKIVANVGVGYNHIDVPLVRSYGVKISNTPDVLSSAVAEMGMTLLLSSARNLLRFVEINKSPSFNRWPLNDMSSQASGSTLGIVGMGRIGYLLAKRAHAFEMNILYHNRSRRSEEEEKAVDATYYSKLNEMLPLCDFVVVVVCLTPETKHIIGVEQLKLMKKSATLVNISRGDTIDQDALVQALKSGEIGSAALDVTTPEPLPRDHELLRLPNVFITPHVSSQTRTTRLKMIRLAVQNVLAASEGRDLPTEIPY